jgi:alkylhydroperoxidase family enzyme
MGREGTVLSRRQAAVCIVKRMTEPLKPRLRLATDDELPERYRSRTDAVTRVFGHNATLLENWYRWYLPLIRDLSLPARLKEIVRFRVAQLNACDF